MNLERKSFFRSPFSIFFSLAAVAFLLYAVILPTPFKSLDDYVSIINNVHVHAISFVPNLFTSSFFGEHAYYRPLVLLSFLAEYLTHGLNPFFYNLDNLLLHIFNAMGVFWLVAKLLNNRRHAFFVALLFVLHPVHWEAVGNIAGRSILLSSFFLLYGFLSFIRFCERRSFLFWLLSFLCFAGALLSKESGLMLLGILPVYLYLFHNPQKKLFLKSYLSLVPFVFFVLFYLWIRARLDIYQHIHWTSWGEMALGVGSFLIALFHYLKMMVVPTDFYFDYASPMYRSFTDPRLWGAAVFWIGLIFILFKKRHALGRVNVFFLIWIALNLFPVMELVPIRVPKDNISTPDHFLYLPLIGFLVVAFDGVRHYASRAMHRGLLRKKVWQSAVVLYFFYLALVCLTQNLYATNMFAMYEKALAFNPDNTRVRNSLAVAYAMTGHLEEAAGHFDRILKEEPYNPNALIGLAQTFNDRHRYWDALRTLDRVIDPGSFADFYKNSKTYALEQLMKEYRADLKKDPKNIGALYSLGVVYAKAKRYKKAQHYFAQTLALDPTHEQALFNMGVVLTLQEKYPQAITYYQKVIANPSEEEQDAVAYQYLSLIYQKQGDKKKAQECLAKAKELGIIKNQNKGAQ